MIQPAKTRGRSRIVVPILDVEILYEGLFMIEHDRRRPEARKVLPSQTSWMTKPLTTTLYGKFNIHIASISITLQRCSCLIVYLTSRAKWYHRMGKTRHSIPRTCTKGFGTRFLSLGLQFSLRHFDIRYLLIITRNPTPFSCCSRITCLAERFGPSRPHEAPWTPPPQRSTPLEGP